MMGGGIGQSDAGRVIVVFERALRIALLLTDVDAVVVAFDLIRLHADRNSVVSERGVRLAYLPLPAVAGAIDRSQVFTLRRPKLIMRVQALAPNLLACLQFFVIERELEQSMPTREAFEPFGQLA